jgi:RHS repeat-associated protein
VYLHQGGRYEFATNLYSFRFRNFWPILGRWAEVDPIRFAAGDANLYAYVTSNPVIGLDPQGLLAIGVNGVSSFGIGYYTAFCNSVCEEVNKSPKLNPRGRLGGQYCKDGVKCACLTDYVRFPTGFEYKLGKCPGIDECGFEHEVGHFDDVECPQGGFGITKAKVKPGVDPILAECEPVKKEIACLTTEIKRLKQANEDNCNDDCIKTATVLRADQQHFYATSCRGK